MAWAEVREGYEARACCTTSVNVCDWTRPATKTLARKIQRRFRNRWQQVLVSVDLPPQFAAASMAQPVMPRMDMDAEWADLSHSPVFRFEQALMAKLKQVAAAVDGVDGAAQDSESSSLTESQPTAIEETVVR